MGIVQLFVLSIALVWANLSEVSAEEKFCNNSSNLQALALCLSEMDGEWLDFRAQLETAKYKLEIANELPNPELNWQFGYGRFLGDEVWQNQVNLSQPILFGGKRNAKYNLAQKENNITELKAHEKKIEIVNEILKKFTQVKSLLLEIELSNDAYLTLKKSISLYKTKPRLDPEQKTALYLLEMNMEQVDSNITKLKYEKLDVLAKIQALALKKISMSELEAKILTSEDPKFENNFKIKGGEITLHKRIRQSELEYRAAQYRYEVAYSWPDFKIGPSVTQQNQAGLQQYLVGFNVTFGIPVFNLNGANRENRKALLKSYEITKNVLDLQYEVELETNLNKFNETLAKYSSLPTPNVVLKKVTEIGKLLERGLISVTSFIEVKRSTLEYIKSRHEMQANLYDLFLKLKHDLNHEETCLAIGCEDHHD